MMMNVRVFCHFRDVQVLLCTLKVNMLIYASLLIYIITESSNCLRDFSGSCEARETVGILEGKGSSSAPNYISNDVMTGNGHFPKLQENIL